MLDQGTDYGVAFSDHETAVILDTSASPITTSPDRGR